MLWVTQSCKIKNAEEVDGYICPEIPYHVREHILYKVVADFMIHGPCGLVKPNSSCMSKGSFSKNFQKSTSKQHTLIKTVMFIASVKVMDLL